MDIIFKPGKILTYEYFLPAEEQPQSTDLNPKPKDPEKSIFAFSLKTLEDHTGFKALLEQAVKTIKENAFLVDINLSNGYLTLKFPLATVEQKDMYLAVCERAIRDIRDFLEQYPTN